MNNEDKNGMLAELAGLLKVNILDLVQDGGRLREGIATLSPVSYKSIAEMFPGGKKLLG